VAFKLPNSTRKLFSAAGRRGGRARAAALTPQQRSDQARHAALARHQQPTKPVAAPQEPR